MKKINYKRVPVMYKFRFGRFCVLLLISSFFCEGVSAQINALDYTLQKRKKTAPLDSSRFADHMFISTVGGGEVLLGGHSTSLPAMKRIGMNGGFYLGKWFTPVSGFRVGVHGGFLPGGYNPDGSIRRVILPGVSADYLMNFTGLAYGYDRNRLFDVVGVGGLSYQVAMYDGTLQNTIGAHLGLLARFNVSPLVNLFIEPRLTAYSDGIDRQSSWRKYDLAASLMVGLTYKVVPLAWRKKNLFERSSFTDNMFISAGVGAQMLLSQNTLSNIKGAFGPSMSLSIGKWLAPHSGVRLSLTGGLSGWDKSNTYLKVVGGQLDYLLNLNAACQGYDRDRVFELIAVAGLNLSAAQRIHTTQYAPGIGVGIQGNLRLTQNTDLFIEPRVTLYTNKLADGQTSSSFDALANLNIGFIYNVASGSTRYKARLINDSFSDNMFISLSGGPQIVLSTAKRMGLSFGQFINPKASVSLGKWFTSVSGLRLSGDVGTLGSRDADNKFKRYILGSVSAEYMLNVTSLMTGYNPDRVFELIGLIGVNALIKNGSESNFMVGGNIGLQALFNVSPSVGVYLEPQIRIYPDKFTHSNIGIINADATGSLVLGVNYRMRGYDRAESRARFEEQDRNDFFFSLSGGVAGLQTSMRKGQGLSNKIGVTGAISFGKWYTPLSAWRVGVNGMHIPNVKNRKIQYFGANLDYLMNLSTLFAGYNSDRIFEVAGIAGIDLGASSSRSKLVFIPGFHVGLQGVFNVSPQFDLYIEPKLNFYSDKFDTFRSAVKSDIGASFMVGLNYKMKLQHSAQRAMSRRAVSGINNSFVSAAVGTGILSTGLFAHIPVSQKLNIAAEVGVGTWFTQVSGLRVAVNSMTVTTNFKTPHNYTFMGLNADYLINLSALTASYTPDQLFELIGVAGINLNWGLNNVKAKNIFGATLGVQAKFNINKRVSVYLEPRLGIFSDKLDGYNSTIGVEATGNLMIGTAYKF